MTTARRGTGLPVGPWGDDDPFMDAHRLKIERAVRRHFIAALLQVCDPDDRPAIERAVTRAVEQL